MSHKLIHDVSVVLGEVETQVFQDDQEDPFPHPHADYMPSFKNRIRYMTELSTSGDIENLKKQSIFLAASLVRMLADMK